MARFPFPILRRPDGDDVQKVENFTSQEELEARERAEDARHQESLDAQKKISEKEEKDRARAEKARIREQKNNLRDLSDKFDSSLRTGLFGRLSYIIKNKDDYLENSKNILKDTLQDTFFGKSIKDQQNELEGMIKNSLIARIRGEDKYKRSDDAPIEDDEEEEQKPEVLPTQIDVGKILNPVEITGADFRSDDGGDFVIPAPKEFPTKIDIGEDETAVNKEIPVLEAISNSMSSLLTTFVSFASRYEAELEDKARKENASGILSRFSKSASPKIEVVKKGLLDLGPWAMVGLLKFADVIKDTVFGGLTAASKFISRAMPIVGFATSLYLMVKDAVGGWFSSEAWGVDKIPGLIGGLIGGLDSGVWNSLKNAGKWALFGASVGSVVPVIGTLAGGLIGAVFGGVMGYFGGEKIAQVVQNVSDWAVARFNEITDSIKWFFTELPTKIGEYIKSTYDELVLWGKDKIASIKTSISDFMDSIEKYFKSFFTLDYWIGKEGTAQAVEPRIESSRDVQKSKIMEAETEDRTPLRVEIAPNRDIENLTRSMDSFIKNIESQPKAVAKEVMTQRIYEKSIENSVTNNNSSSNDYSRTTNQTVTSNSFNRATVNLTGSPNTRNQESSAFGTRSFVNGGFGNPSRY